MEETLCGAPPLIPAHDLPFHSRALLTSFMVAVLNAPKRKRAGKLKENHEKEVNYRKESV